MKKMDWNNLIIIFATLITSVLSSVMFSLLSRFIFIVIFMIFCCLLFNYLDNKTTKKLVLLVLAITAEILILGISIMKISPTNFFDQIKKFFVTPQEASNENIISLDANLELYFNDLSRQIEDIDKKLENNTDSIEKMNNELNVITNDWNNIYFNENRSDSEINEIVNLIEEKCDENSDSFANLRSDLYSIEILYKAFISENTYYYCNILEAFDTYGIKTDKLGITENILFIWDIERLYMTYNMKNSIAGELNSDEIIDEKSFNYNDYKVNLNRFSDTFNYGNWRKFYTEYTPKQIDDMLNTSIMNFYKKFIINFSTE